MKPIATYKQPRHGWTCFHCGLTFTDSRQAQLHFGPRPGSMPDCGMTPSEVLTRLRHFEFLLGELCDPDDDRADLTRRRLLAFYEKAENI